MIVLATSSAYQPIKQRPRKGCAQIAGDTLAGHAADFRADLLDGDHQRIAEQQRPAHGIAELGPGLGIGGDAAGIVVGRAGNQAGAHDLHQLGMFRLLDRRWVE